MARLGGVRRMQQRQALGKIGSGLEITVGGDHLERERERMGEADGGDEIKM